MRCHPLGGSSGRSRQKLGFLAQVEQGRLLSSFWQFSAAPSWTFSAPVPALPPPPAPRAQGLASGTYWCFGASSLTRIPLGLLGPEGTLSFPTGMGSADLRPIKAGICLTVQISSLPLQKRRNWTATPNVRGPSTPRGPKQAPRDWVTAPLGPGPDPPQSPYPARPGSAAHLLPRISGPSRAGPAGVC